MALGLIEVFGFTTSIVVADAVAKAADVTIVALDKNKPANGDAAEVPLLMTIKFEGDVAAVEAGMQAGVAAVIVDVVLNLGAGVLKEKRMLLNIIMVAAFAAALMGVNVVYIILASGVVGIVCALTGKGKKHAA